MDKARKSGSYFNLYRHDFVRVAVATPEVRVADPAYNAAQTVALMREAAARKAMLAVFPELGLSAYSCEDLFHQQALQSAAAGALARVASASRALNLVAVVGLPLRVDGLLYNCAAVICRGQILGVVPKSYPPNYREFYELRHFAPGDYAVQETIDVAGQSDVPFGVRLLFEAEDQPLFVLAVEICEDLWTPIPPSSFAALAGATVVANLSASNVTVGKDHYRAQLVANQSGRCVVAYAYAAAGFGESSTDLAWDGHGMICENGAPLAASRRFAYAPQLISADVDLERLAQDRSRQTSFAQSAAQHAGEVMQFRRVRFSAGLPAQGTLLLERDFERFPYVPSDPQTRDSRCRDVYAIQVQGLVKRLRAMGSERLVIGVSGGLDSTQALIVCARAMDTMRLPRSNILACTLPGFATSERTLSQARRLMAVFGCTAKEIDIRPACTQMLKDIGHPYADGMPVHDVTFENVQAGERASLLFRLAGRDGAPVVGTSDLSELALGWTTYGVGDQMAHYHVNASVPKTLIQHLIRHVAASREFGEEASCLLEEVLATDISPELVPGTVTGTNGDQPAQSTEAIVGPYELQDMNLYYTLRFGFDPARVAFIVWSAWHDSGRGDWPDVPESARRAYGIAEIRKWLAVFVRRFFQSSQYKRSAIANAPKIGSGGSLSPRGDWRAPSDGEAAAWLARLEEIPEQEPDSGRR